MSLFSELELLRQSPTSSLYDTCRRAFQLVHRFQTDTPSWGSVSNPSNKPGYVYDPKLRQEVKEKVSKSLKVLDTAIDRHGLEEFAISYNGGKDCLVMLILVLATIYKKYKEGASSVGPTLLREDYKLDAIYVNSETPFPVLTDFINRSTIEYNLHPVVIKSSMKEGFESYLKENPQIKSIVVGIRHSDPYGSDLQYEQVTDGDWPRFLRIHPILHWDYVHIWDFLIGCDVEYCAMYDWGYTSLGGINNTLPNPYLMDPQDEGAYFPAYMLREDADNRERLGRNKKKDPQNQTNGANGKYKDASN